MALNGYFSRKVYYSFVHGSYDFFKLSTDENVSRPRTSLYEIAIPLWERMRKHASGCRSAIDKSKDPGRCRLTRKSLYRPSALPLQSPPPNTHSPTRHHSSSVSRVWWLGVSLWFSKRMNEQRLEWRSAVILSTKLY